MNNMKDNWEIKKLGDVCEKIIAGGDKPKEFSISMTDEYSVPIFANGEKNKGLVGYTNLARISKPSITISGRGTIGYSEIRTQPFVPIVRLITLLPNNEIVDIYFLQYGLKNIDFLNSGSSIPQLTVPMVKGYSIPLTPLPEQKRIVSILDRSFAAIDKAKANAEQNLNNAKELFESYLQGVFEKKGDDWEEQLLKEITEVKDGTHDSPKYIKEGIPFVTQKNIKAYGFTIENTKFITEIDHQKFYKRSNVTFGDILISMIGANRGMSAIVNIKDTFSIKNVGLIKKSKNINQHFLLYYLQSTFAMKYVKFMSNGGAQEFIGLTALRAFPIPFPKTIKEQKQIVHKLDALSAETKKLEAIYQQKITNLEELEKSVLQKAFRGEL
jgi:type I restriction enzyme S subunit